ncbi:uncharacterized protein LOC132729261 [Ruditapes philippinarum]|uniref:uncharacterized protein LOC132729261 n=1 Tax=Ruditapes philippinarum TaxID=129788 RepID=UPI00295B789B|nr:uncharacterized protein LOC132729261 [Ruditapes philippinarum]
MSATVNKPDGDSSISGSDDETASNVKSNDTSNVKKEEHLNSLCKYELRHDIVYDVDVYMLKRVCKCKQAFEDRSELLEEKELDLGECDGKEIHFSSTCEWVQSPMKGGAKYILTASCNCKRKEQQCTHQTSASINKVQSNTE